MQSQPSLISALFMKVPLLFVTAVLLYHWICSHFYSIIVYPVSCCTNVYIYTNIISPHIKNVPDRDPGTHSKSVRSSLPNQCCIVLSYRKRHPEKYDEKIFPGAEIVYTQRRCQPPPSLSVSSSVFVLFSSQAQCPY